MTGEKRRQRMRRGDDVHAPGRGRVPRAVVVVAAHQRQRDVRMGGAPGEERGVERRDAARGGVQEIAEHDEAPCARPRDQRREPREVGLRAAARQREPPARNAAALPRCTSATNSVAPAGQYSARSACNSTRSPASDVDHADGLAPPRQAGGLGSDCG